jgi:hypothetical protein
VLQKRSAQQLRCRAAHAHQVRLYGFAVAAISFLRERYAMNKKVWLRAGVVASGIWLLACCIAWLPDVLECHRGEVWTCDFILGSREGVSPVWEFARRLGFWRLGLYGNLLFIAFIPPALAWLGSLAFVFAIRWVLAAYSPLAPSVRSDSNGHWFDTSHLPGVVKKIAETIQPPPAFPDLAEYAEDNRKYVVEEWKFRTDLWKFQLSSMTEQGKHAFELSKISVTQLLAVNAGSAAALLALCGNLDARLPGGRSLLQAAFWSVSAFIVGVVATLGITAATQLNLRFLVQHRFKPAVIFSRLTIGLYVVSVTSFVVGALLGAGVILSPARP